MSLDKLSLDPMVICIMGPTACGKTDLAIALAKHFDIEIINVDSAQIYQGMTIGSGMPSKELRTKVPHHLMDFLDPALTYSAAQFRKDALLCIKEIIQRHRIPVLVGGTMLYFKALQQGLSQLPDADKDVRLKLEEKLKTQGLSALYEMLKTIDPVAAARINPNDPQRIQRALEIYEITGSPMTYWLNQPIAEVSPFRFCNIALIPIETPRKILHERIALRFHQMLENGLIEEVKKLFARDDLNEKMPAIRAVGYRQVWHYLKNEVTYEQMQEKAIAATRQLAKRQLTWLRSWPEVTTFDFAAPTLLNKVLVYLQNQGIPVISNDV